MYESSVSGKEKKKKKATEHQALQTQIRCSQIIA